MKRKEYCFFLGLLPIKSPTPEDMAKFCPHLTLKEAVQAFTTGIGFVACPPIKVRGALQIISYRPERVRKVRKGGKVVGSKNWPAKLDWSYAGRTPSGCATEAEATAFAEANWGNELVLDDWVSVVELCVQDPTDLVNDRYHTDYPRTKAVLYVALKRDFNTIASDRSKPESELLDEAISQMTLDYTVWHEIKGGRGGFVQFNCAHCSAGLSLSSCTGCGHQFRDDPISRYEWSTPLSRKMVAFLRESGHEFMVDPEIAWKKELDSFHEMYG